jgi:RNA polymerase sigma factor (sigma-70 family)
MGVGRAMPAGGPPAPPDAPRGRSEADGGAFAARLPDLAPVLFAYLRRWVPRRDLDDVVQIVFLDLWRTRQRYDDSRSLEAWALAIARRRAIDYLRARPRVTAALGEIGEPSGEDGRAVAARLADRSEIESALAALPPAQREAIELAYFGELSQREIAERLRVPIGTIKARIARGLRAARRLLTSAEAG